jgi:hypothetical protein
MDTAELARMIEERCRSLNLAESRLSRAITGHGSLVSDIRRGRSPSADRLERICRELGLEFYVGPRREDPSESVNPARVSRVGPPARNVPFVFDEAHYRAHRALSAGPPSSSESVPDRLLSTMISVLSDEYRHQNAEGRLALVKSLWEDFPDVVVAGLFPRRVAIALGWRRPDARSALAGAAGAAGGSAGSGREGAGLPEPSSIEPFPDAQLALAISALSVGYARLNERGRRSFGARFRTTFSGLQERASRLNDFVVSLEWKDLEEVIGPEPEGPSLEADEADASPLEATMTEPVPERDLREALSIVADEYRHLNVYGRRSLMIRFWHSFPDLRTRTSALRDSVVALAWHRPEDTGGRTAPKDSPQQVSGDGEAT